MRIYLDLIFFLNFVFDFILLLSVTLILRRNIKIRRLILGSLIGSLSIFILFLNINNFQLFIIKGTVSIIMTLITFNYRNLRYTLKNLFYLYTSSIILGGFLYYLNLEFSYKQEGLVFYHAGFSINVIVLIVLSPIIIYMYVRQIKELKNNYSNYYKVDIYLRNGRIIPLSAFLDTGNRLYDPYFKRPIVLVNKKEFKERFSEDETILVPYDTINNHGLLKCVIPDKIYIDNVGIRHKFLIGLCEEKIKIDGIDCILHASLMEE